MIDPIIMLGNRKIQNLDSWSLNIDLDDLDTSFHPILINGNLDDDFFSEKEIGKIFDCKFFINENEFYQGKLKVLGPKTIQGIGKLKYIKKPKKVKRESML